MREFSIAAIGKDGNIEQEIKDKIQSRSEDYNSPGRMATVILQIGLVQKTVSPVLKRPVLLIFAADHGFVKEEMDPAAFTPTYKSVLSYLNDRGAVNALCRKNNIHLKVIDVGVDHPFEGMLTFWLHHGKRLINRKISFATRNFSHFPAMDSARCRKAMLIGEDLVKRAYRNGTNVIALGNLGAGNIASAMALTMALLEAGPEEFKQGKFDASRIEKAVKKHPKTRDPLTLLTLYGGFEIASVTGAILKAAELRMMVLLDGSAALSALLLACSINENVRDYILIADAGNDPLQAKIIRHLDVQPVLNLGLEMGEGSGAAMVFPLIQSVLHIYNNLSDPEDEID